MTTKQQQQQQASRNRRGAALSSWSVVVAPLRRRLLAGASHFRTAFTQCFPFSSQGADGNPHRSKKPKKQSCQPDDGEKNLLENDQGRTLLLPVGAPLISLPPSPSVEGQLVMALPLSPISVETVSSSTSDQPVADGDEHAKNNTKLMTPVTTATVILEPLHHSCRAAVNRAKFARPSLRQVSSSSKSSSSAQKTPSNNKPVSSSSRKTGFRPRFGLKSSSTSSAPSATPSQSTSTNNAPPPNPGASSAKNRRPPPTFHSASASTPCCLMTFVIFTNGSSTRMWFLVARQPPRTARPPPTGARRSFFGNNNNHGNHNGHSSASSSSSSSSSSRRQNASSPTATNCSTEKRRSLINRFLCSDDTKCTGSDGRSRLAIAASWACPAAIKLLLRRGAPVNSVDSRGKAALHYVAYGHSSVEAVVECLLLLLDAGAKVNCFDDENNTPLHLAALAGCGPAMGLLLRRGADSSLPNTTGRTPVFNFLNNAFNADNIPALLELACASPYAFAGAFHYSAGKMAKSAPSAEIFSFNMANITLDSCPSKKLIDDTGRIPLVLKLTLQPSLMPVHVDESLVLSPQFKKLLCLFATCPPSLQLLAAHSIRGAVLEALSVKNAATAPSSASITAAADVIDLPNSLKCLLFS